MPQVLPFRGLRPAAATAATLISPPYDVLDRAEARQLLESGQRQFLRVSRPDAELPESVGSFDNSVYSQGLKNLNELRQGGQLHQDNAESYYVYRIADGSHSQTGLVATVLCADYECNRIRKHELTRPEKERDRRLHMDTLGAQTGPVLMTHEGSESLEGLLESITVGPAEYLDLDLDGVKHSLWRVEGQEVIREISRHYEALDNLYIADGHHRSAAACAGSSPEEGVKRKFLAVMFPNHQLQVLDYNRVVRDLGGLDEEAFLARLRQVLEVTDVAGPWQPEARGQFGMYLGGKWYLLSVPAASSGAEDIVDRLDVSLLANLILEPILGIGDVRRDPRIDFVGGSRGLDELESRVDSGDMLVAFSMFPTSIEDVMAVADERRTMPPKSTWFHPKLADGLVSYVMEEEA